MLLKSLAKGLIAQWQRWKLHQKLNLNVNALLLRKVNASRDQMLIEV
jgi:hypothetical protein